MVKKDLKIPQKENPNLENEQTETFNQKNIEKKKQDIGLMREKTSQEGTKEKTEEEKQAEEKLKFLKREDIRTMKKDISKLREEEAGKESEEISLSGTEDKHLKKERGNKEKKKEIIDKAPIMPTFSKRASSSNKLFVRLVFVFIIILIGGGIYWFSTTQKKVIVKTPPTEEKKEVSIPATFATVASTFPLKLEEKQRMISRVESLDPKNLAENGPTRLVIKDSKGKLITFDEIEKLFGIDFTPTILGKIDKEDFNLLALKKEGRIEKSLIIKTNAKILNPNTEWEKSIDKKLITPKQGEEKASLFEDLKSENRDIRCLKTSSNYKLSFCYTTISNYLVLSESFDAMQPTLIGINDITRKKIGQLFVVGFDGTVVTPETRAFFQKYYPGGVLLLSKNILSGHQILKLNTELQSLSSETSGQPLLIAIDQEGGPVSRISFLDELTPQSKIKESNNAYQIGIKRGEELKEIGINLNLSPLMDNVSKDDFIYNRSFQETPKIAGELGKALILGQQESGVFSVVKHFPGYVGMRTNPEEELMVTSASPVITQFQETMKVNPKFVMTANAIYKSIDPSSVFTFSETGIKYLKRNLNRKILIISDDLSQDSLLNAFTLKEIVSNPIKAGVDMEIFSGYKSPVDKALDAFLNAVNNQEISLEKIDTATLRITQLKKEL